MGLSDGYDYLHAQSAPFSFELSIQQKQHFLTVFQNYKDELLDQVSPEMGGIINRLGIITFRIAMQLTVVRALDKDTLKSESVCTDVDFNTALLIANTLILHTVATFKQYPQYKFLHPGPTENSTALDAQQIRQCRELRAQGVTIRKIAEMVLGDAGRKTTVERWTK